MPSIYKYYLHCLQSKLRSGWNLFTHTKVDKKNYKGKNGINLFIRGRKGLPISFTMGIFIWTYASMDASTTITIKFWPEDDGSGTAINYNIEYNMNKTDYVLIRVSIVIPFGTMDPPNTELINCGQYNHDVLRVPTPFYLVISSREEINTKCKVEVHWDKNSNMGGLLFGKRKGARGGGGVKRWK